MDTVIWYSWLGGIIIGTMIGANMVLEEHCRAGPRNVVITGRYLSLSPLSMYHLLFIYRLVNIKISEANSIDMIDANS